MQFQTGLKNILDRAVLKHKEVHAELDVHRLHRPGQRSVIEPSATVGF